MSPLLVFDRATGAFQLATGSAGGPAIITTAKSLLGFEWGPDAQQAADLPNFGSFNGPTWLESGTVSRGHLERAARAATTVSKRPTCRAACTHADAGP